MADTIIDRLFIAFGVNADGVQKGMSKAESIIHKGIDRIKSVIMPLATGFALTSMVQGFVEGATEAAKAAERLGMSMEDLQAWQGAVQALGAESSVAGEMLGVLNEKLVDAAKMGGTGSLELFKKLGISIKDNAGNMRLASDVLLDLAGASEWLSKQELYGYSKALGLSPEMIDLLVQGRKGLEDLLKAQKELAVFQKEDAEIAKKGRIAWQGFMKSQQAIQAVIMRAVMPALVTMVNWLTKASVWARNNQPFMIALITGLALVITKMLVPAMLKLGASSLAAIAPWLLLIAIITAVALAVDDFWTYLEGGESAFPEVWKYMLKFFGFFQTSIDGAKKWWQNACEFWAAVFEGNWEKAGSSFIGMFEGIIQLVYGLFEGLGFYILDLIDTFTGGAVTKAKDALAGFLNWAKGAWDSVKDFFGFGSDTPVSENTGQNENTSISSDMGIPQNSVPAANPSSDMGIPQNSVPAANPILPKMELEHKTPLYTVSDTIARNAISPQAAAQNTKITSSTSVGSITINTQATDAAGIAKEIKPALKNEFDASSFMMASNTGVIAK